MCLADYFGCIGRHGWSLVWLVARPCLVWRLPTAGGWGRVLAAAAYMARGIPVLVPAHRWVEPGPGVTGYRAGVLRANVRLLMGRTVAWREVQGLLSACWWEGPIPDMAGCRVWSDLELVMACWWVRPGRRASASLLVGRAGSDG